MNRIYIADQGNGRIARVNTMAGAGWVAVAGTPAPVGAFVRPSCVCVDNPTGRIYIADTGNNRIVRLNAIPVVVAAKFGSLGVPPGHFNTPFGVFVK